MSTNDHTQTESPRRPISWTVPAIGAAIGVGYLVGHPRHQLRRRAGLASLQAITRNCGSDIGPPTGTYGTRLGDQCRSA